MAEQLSSLLQMYWLTKRNQQNVHIKGQIIQILKTLSYFQSQAHLYGNDILQYYLPLLDIYTLRKNCQFFDQTQLYVVFEGMLRNTHDFSAKVYSDGMLLQIEKTEDSKTMISLVDTVMIKVYRNVFSMPKLAKKMHILSKMEKQRAMRLKEIQKKIYLDPILPTYKAILDKHQFFSIVSVYDLTLLISESKIISLAKNSITHNHGGQVKKLGYILDGKIKISHPLDSTIHHEVEPGKMILEKYMIHKKYKNKGSIVSHMIQGQWLGLQELLWDRDYVSKGEVVSHQLQILTVPVEIFKAVFRDVTNYNLMAKLRGLVETKKMLMDKNVKSKREKQRQMLDEILRKQALEKFTQKMKKVNQSSQFSIQKSNKTGRRQHLSQRLKPLASEEKQKSKNRGISSIVSSFSPQKTCPKQCYMPQKLVHKIQIFQKKYESSPNYSERISLFPQQYQKASVPLQMKEKIAHFQRTRVGGPIKQKKPTRSFNLLRSDRIHQKVLFDTLSPLNETQKLNPESKNSSKNLKTKRSSQSLHKINSTENLQGKHFNQSIFNNFRAPKLKDRRLLEKMSQTLDIN